MIDRFSASIPPSIRSTSGKVFYSGRTAFSSPSKLYILGLNPGGSPQEKVSETVESDTQRVLNGSADWSAYQDEEWEGKPPGTHGMQPRVRCLLRQLNLDPQKVPASNLIFVRDRKSVV